MAHPKVPKKAVDDGRVYFCYQHAVDSFSGTLEHEQSFDDEQVKDFIRYANPKLYERLGGLPFSCTDIPLSFYAQRQLRKTYEMQEKIDHGTYHNHVPSLYAYETVESVPQATSSIENDHHHTLQMLELQVKRHIQKVLLEHHSLILQKLSSRNDSVYCLSPTCPREGLIFDNAFYLKLAQNIFPYSYAGLCEFRNQELYCLSCLEDIFDGQRNEADATTEHVQDTTSIGVNHNIVLDSATRLHAPRQLHKDLHNDEEPEKVKAMGYADHFTTSDVENGSVDKYEVERKAEGSGEAVPSWGVPINGRKELVPNTESYASKSIRSEFTQFPCLYATTNPIPRRTETAASPDGFGDVSDGLDNSSIILQANDRSSCHGVTCLFPGSSYTTFGDLAPFITTEGLSRAENEIVDKWRDSLPVSRLVRALLRREIFDEAMMVDEIVPDAETQRNMRLSELFDRV